MTRKDFKYQMNESRSRSIYDYENPWYIKLVLKDGSDVMGMVWSYKVSRMKCNVTIVINKSIVKYKRTDIKYII